MTKLKKCLYLDDIKIPTEQLSGYEPWHIVRDFREFKKYITECGMPDYISFDHDLDEEHHQQFLNNQRSGNQTIDYDSFTEYTGLDCLEWLCSYIYNQMAKEDYIRLRNIGIHDMNPIGAQNLLDRANELKESTNLPINIFIKTYKWK
jgi:hypothetical protein